MPDRDFDLGSRLDALEKAHYKLIIDYLESRPLGSFVTKEQWEQASAGFRPDFRELRAVLDEEGSTRAIWTCKKDGRFVGLFVLSIQAVRQFENYQA